MMFFVTGAGRFARAFADEASLLPSSVALEGTLPEIFEIAYGKRIESLSKNPGRDSSKPANWIQGTARTAVYIAGHSHSRIRYLSFAKHSLDAAQGTSEGVLELGA